MLLITQSNTNPYFNIASEEYLLREFDEEIIYLWRNDNAVIVGKHQNTIEEINKAYVDANNINVVRRLTGGGAVYHDINNVNFSMIKKLEGDLFSNYEAFTEPVCGYLNELGVNASLNGRNDITIDGLKFSGNAQAVIGNRIMHHGTLLFSSNESTIEGALKPSKLKIESKGVKSVRSRITNISSHLKEAMTTEEFMSGLYHYFERNTSDCIPYSFSNEDIKAIEKLAKDKYETWKWNYGRSPQYSFRNQKRFEFGIVDVCLDVSNGKINDAHFFGDFFASEDIKELEGMLKGCDHNKEALAEKIAGIDVSVYISGMSSDQLLDMLVR